MTLCIYIYAPKAAFKKKKKRIKKAHKTASSRQGCSACGEMQKRLSQLMQILAFQEDLPARASLQLPPIYIWGAAGLLLVSTGGAGGGGQGKNMIRWRRKLSPAQVL